MYSSVMGHLGCFQLLAFTNKVTMNIVEHMSLSHGGASFGYIPKSGIAGSSGRSISNLLRNFRLISKVIAPVCNTPRNGGLFFLHILSNMYCHLMF